MLRRLELVEYNLDTRNYTSHYKTETWKLNNMQAIRIFYKKNTNARHQNKLWSILPALELLPSTNHYGETS